MSPTSEDEHIDTLRNIQRLLKLTRDEESRAQTIKLEQYIHSLFAPAKPQVD